MLRRPRVALICAALAAACAPAVVRERGALPAPPPARDGAVRILVLGDFGEDTFQQRAVSRAIARAHRALPFDLAIQLGDNLYPCGPDPVRAGAERCRFAEDGASLAPDAPAPDDPLFRVAEEPLEPLRRAGGAPLPILLALGNHDIGWEPDCGTGGLSRDEAHRRRACLEVARRTPEWSMPARHYVVDRGPVRLVVLDTNAVVADYAGFTLEDEIAFVREAVRGCEERLCLLAGHHPPAAAIDHHPPGPEFHARMARVLEVAAGRIGAFLGGHEHSLQHLTLGGLDVLVSGSTARGGFDRFLVRYPAAARVRFASSAAGFGALEVDAAGWSFRFEDASGRAVHCCDAEGRGPCRPVRCARD
jgi:hypothetical protein